MTIISIIRILLRDSSWLESLRRSRVALIINRMISVCSKSKTFNITVIQFYAQPLLPKKLKLTRSMKTYGAPLGSDGKESVCNAGDSGSIRGSGTLPGEGNGYPLQYSCLEDSMEKGARWAIIHGVTESQTRLSE